MNYRREIDGLRALAVLPVILFHAGFETFRGGFVGVDVFFVISGYLITSIILAEIEQGKFSIVNFYERRARRILPALFLVMLACLPFAWFFLLPNNIRDFSRSLVAVPLFISNILFWKESGYFDTAAELKPLLHTWSLAVEEQYYVLFPLFLMLCWRLGRRWLVVILAGAFMSSLAIAQWGSIAKPTAAFFLLPTRGWELLVGAFAAFYSPKTDNPQFSRAVGEAGGWLGVALITYAVLMYSQTTPFPGLYALVPTIGAVLIILFATQDTTVGKFVGNRVFVGVGLISFSAYLWHQPLFAFARHQGINEPSHADFAVLFVISLVLAYFSWRYVEGPFRSKANFSRARIFTLSAAGSLLFLGIGLLGHYNYKTIVQLWVQRYPEQHQAFYKTLFSDDPSVENYGMSNDGVQRLGDCRFNLSTLTAETEQTLKSCYAKYGSGVLIFGDSHSVDLYGAVASKFQDRFLVGITAPGCRPHTPSPDCPYEKISTFAKKNRQVFNHVIFEQSGAYLLLDTEKQKGDRKMFARIPYGTPAQGFSFDEEHIKRTLDYLVDFSSAVPVTWFLPRIEPHIDRKLLFRQGCEFNWALRPGLDKTFHNLDARLAKAVKDSHAQQIKTVSQNDVFAFAFPSDFLTCNDVYWTDGDHLSRSGEQRFGQRLPDSFLRF